MEIFVDDSGTLKGFARIADEALASGAKSLLVMSCDDNGFDAESLAPVLKDLPVPVFGGIFPMLLHERRQLEKGTIIVGMEQPAAVHYIEGLSDPDVDYEAILDEIIGDDDTIKTLLLFVDGLSTRIAAFVDALYTIFGLELNYVGGGAGSLSLQQKPCVITNEGLKTDGVVLAAFPMASGVGVSHGWKTVSGPYKVTEVERNIVKSLDWRPAFEVYREVVEEHEKTPFQTDNFFDIAKAYPFGIARMESERVVRDILSLDDDNNLVCVVELPAGVYVDILHAESEDLIKAAQQAHARALANFPKDNAGIELFIDCISRVLFLQELFSKEISAVTPPGPPMVGACTIGEIANSGSDYLEFYNKTSVVAFLEDK